ncbi:MAG: type II toxin-antitoxin system VapC family toxin [Treponema sp.]|nr:type II toxin-antitoxin system VapC family toxin [Treponema sp.]
MIFDTDVLIWAFKKNKNAMQLLYETEGIFISAVTHMELLQGALNKQELSQIKKFLKAFGIQTLYITPEITKRAMDYVENYALSDSMQLADALIAATAIENEETLCTANVKHYKCIHTLNLNMLKVTE